MSRHELLLLAGLLLMQKCFGQEKRSGMENKKSFEKKEVEDFMNCVFDDARCSQDNKMYKDILPFIYFTKCKLCDKEQLELFNIADNAIKEYFPEKYEAYLKKMEEDASRFMLNNFD